jgi:hypothetical protein
MVRMIDESGIIFWLEGLVGDEGESDNKGRDGRSRQDMLYIISTHIWLESDRLGSK